MRSYWSVVAQVSINQLILNPHCSLNRIKIWGTRLFAVLEATHASLQVMIMNMILMLVVMMIVVVIIMMTVVVVIMMMMVVLIMIMMVVVITMFVMAGLMMLIVMIMKFFRQKHRD